MEYQELNPLCEGDFGWGVILHQPLSEGDFTLYTLSTQVDQYLPWYFDITGTGLRARYVVESIDTGTLYNAVYLSETLLTTTIEVGGIFVWSALYINDKRVE